MVQSAFFINLTYDEQEPLGSHFIFHPLLQFGVSAKSYSLCELIKYCKYFGGYIMSNEGEIIYRNNEPEYFKN